MPPAKKLDLIPQALKKRLEAALAERGFGDIVAVTEELNFWLEDAGLEISVGKTAVGEYSKLLKDQREAFKISELLMEEMDIEKESEIHKVLMHMIASMAMQMMKAVREDDGHLEARELMALGRMLKDLMASAGIREKLREDERQRIVEEARQQQQAEQAARLDEGVAAGRINAEAARAAREVMGLAA